jgi:hypothetical protein
MARNPIIRESPPEVPTITEETPHGCYDGWVFGSMMSTERFSPASALGLYCLLATLFAPFSCGFVA